MNENNIIIAKNRKNKILSFTGIEDWNEIMKEFKECNDFKESNELKELFNQHGRVKSVRIPVDMAGKPKSIALITFSNEKEAMKTILKSDMIEIAGKKLKI